MCIRDRNNEGDVLLEAQYRGSRAEVLSKQPKSLQLSLVIKDFGDALDALPALDAARWAEVVDWTSDKFSRGATTRAGSAPAHEEIAASVEETVFFAGEATADPSAVGTVAGASDSGERAAREVALSLNLELELNEAEPILELL